MLLIYLQNEISTSDVVYIVLLKSGGDKKKEEAEYVYAWIYAICISFRIKKKVLIIRNHPKRFLFWANLRYLIILHAFAKS